MVVFLLALSGKLGSILECSYSGLPLFCMYTARVQYGGVPVLKQSAMCDCQFINETVIYKSLNILHTPVNSCSILNCIFHYQT
jgi:hypothetical protein